MIKQKLVELGANVEFTSDCQCLDAFQQMNYPSSNDLRSLDVDVDDKQSADKEPIAEEI